MQQQIAFDRAEQIRLNFDEGIYVFTFHDPMGEEWEGCLEEWIGNGTYAGSRKEILEYQGRKYIAIGASGGGADTVLIRDDGVICYFNDFVLQVSVVADTIDEFVALLRKSVC